MKTLQRTVVLLFIAGIACAVIFMYKANITETSLPVYLLIPPYLFLVHALGLFFIKKIFAHLNDTNQLMINTMLKLLAYLIPVFFFLNSHPNKQDRTFFVLIVFALYAVFTATDVYFSTKAAKNN